MTTAQLKQTPLASVHNELGARMVDFAGWLMPVQYSSIVGEHMAVRTGAGLFDVSHMGEFHVSGPDSAGFLQYVIANDLNRLPGPNRALYTQLVNEQGGTVDDLIVYRLEEGFLIVVNASNIEKDWEWLTKHSRRFGSVNLRDASEETALLALQGPRASKIMSAMGGEWILGQPSFSYASGRLDGIEAAWGRTGYTGEDGFEIFVGSDKAEALWRRIMERGEPDGLKPAGLGARDTLRLEAALPLYGHELDDQTSPLEAGLGWSVKLEKDDFIGRNALVEQKAQGLKKQLVCLKVDGRALPRQGYKVFLAESEVGYVTSGSQGIFVGYPIACAFVPPACAAVGTHLYVKIRDKLTDAEVVRRPFYRRD